MSIHFQEYYITVYTTDPLSRFRFDGIIYIYIALSAIVLLKIVRIHCQKSRALDGLERTRDTCKAIGVFIEASEECT